MNNGLVGCHVDQSELKYVWANQRTYNCFVLYTDVKSNTHGLAHNDVIRVEALVIFIYYVLSHDYLMRIEFNTTYI